jgi:nucleoside-diphosphate kinase
MKHPKKERTLVIIKPDGVQRGLLGEILKRYEQTGLKLVGLKMTTPTEDFAERHYLLDPDWKQNVGTKTIASYKQKGLEPPSTDPIVVGNSVLEYLKKYITSGPVVALVWEGMNAVGIVRKITGGTEPLTSDVGTIRGDFTIDSYAVADTDARAVRNIIHASGSVEEAEKEISLWFNKEEIANYRLIHEAILYDVNLDGILE